jgi:hypothetical protein
MRKIFILLAALLALLAAALFYFIHSGRLVTIVELTATAFIHQPVSIGALTIEKDRGIIVQDLAVEEGKPGDMVISLPEALIAFTLQGLRNRTIDEVVLEGPEFTLSAFPAKTIPPSGDAATLPFEIRKVQINQGSVDLNLDHERTLHVRDIILSIQQKENNGAAHIMASASVPGHISEISITGQAYIQKLQLLGAQVRISGANLGTISGQLVPLRKEEGQVTGLAEITGEIVQESDEALHWKAEAYVRDFSFTSESLSVKPGHSVALQSEGTYKITHDRVELQHSEVRYGQTARLRLYGTLEGLFSKDTLMALNLENGELALHELFKHLSGSAVDILRNIDLRASAGINLSLTGKVTSPEVSGTVQINGDRFAAGGIDLRSFRAVLPVSYRNGRVLAKDALLRAQHLNGFNMHDTNEHDFRVSGLTLRVPSFEYRDAIIQAGPLSVRAEKAVVFQEGKAMISSADILLKGELHANTKRKKVQLKKLSIATDAIRDVSAYITYAGGTSPAVTASLAWNDINIQSLTERMLPSLTDKIGVNMHGTGSVHTALTITGGNDKQYLLAGTAQAALADGGFTSADERKIGEGIQAELSASYSLSLPFDGAEITLKARASGFELLAGKFYGNFKDRVLACAAAGSYAKDEDTFFLSPSELTLTDMGRLTFSGTMSGPWDSPDMKATMHLSDLDNAEAFNFFIRETFREQLPLLAGLDVDGTSRAQVSFTGQPGKFAVQGMLDIKNMNIVSSEKDRSITGIEINLPFDLSYPEAKDFQGIDDYGKISIDNLSWGILQLKALEAFPAVSRNTMLVRDDIAIHFFGGTVRFRDIMYNNIVSPERSLSMAVTIGDIDLAQTAEALEIPRFNGSLSGVIPKAFFSGNRLTTEGEVVLGLFDGEVRIGNLSVDKVLSPVPSVHASISIESINLEKLTETFDYGRVSGILSGTVNDLVVVNGQAQRFTGGLATMKTKGIKQTINVEALKNISILGTGTSASILDRGIYRFFRNYRYSQIGFSASLKNDNLLLLGIGGEDGVGYLVKGGLLPPKVDVVNYTQNISFKEMVKRLMRIKQAE